MLLVSIPVPVPVPVLLESLLMVFEVAVVGAIAIRTGAVGVGSGGQFS